MNYTSIEQSKKLLELGLSPESADMCYHYPDIQDHNYGLCLPWKKVHPDEKENSLPCWSVGALLEIMPAIIDNEFKLKFVKDNVVPGYYFKYHNRISNSNKVVFASKNSIDALCQMIVWLLENNYIKH